VHAIEACKLWEMDYIWLPGTRAPTDMNNTVELLCPKCSVKIAVPAVSETIHITCPKCQTTWDWPAGAASPKASSPPARPTVIKSTPVYQHVKPPPPKGSKLLLTRAGRNALIVVAIFVGLICIGKILNHSPAPPQQQAYWSPPAPLPTNPIAHSRPADIAPIFRPPPSLPNPLPGKANNPQNAPRPVWDGAPEEPLPQTGDGVFLFDAAAATSKLKFVPNLQQQHVLLKVFDQDNTTLVCWVFIRDQDFVQMEMPPGKYRLRLATGSHWYGETNLFGPYAAYAAISNLITIPFNTVYTIDCNPGINGSLVETRLEAKDF